MACLSLQRLALEQQPSDKTPLCSTIVRKAASTISLGFGIFIVGWILLLVIGFGVPYHSSYNVALQIVFSLFPWSLLAKGIQDLATAAAG